MNLILKSDPAKHSYLAISTMVPASNARSLSMVAAMEMRITLKIYTAVRRVVVVSVYKVVADRCHEYFTKLVLILSCLFLQSVLQLALLTSAASSSRQNVVCKF